MNPGDVEYMELAARDVSKRLPDHHGYILLTFQFGEGSCLRYASNAARSDAIQTLKAFLFKLGEDESWMENVK